MTSVHPVHLTIRALINVLLALFWAQSVMANTSGTLDIADLTPPNFEIFGAKDGLSDEIYSTVGVDPRGFVWAGSASGLYRFDGYRWDHHAVGAAESLVRDMLTVPDGQLWAIFEREGLAFNDGAGWNLLGDTEFSQRFSTTIDAHGRKTHWVLQEHGARRLEDGTWINEPSIAALGPGRNVALARTQRMLGGPRLWLVRSQGGLWHRQTDDPDATWQRLDVDDFNTALFTDLVVSEHQGQEELWILSYGSGILRLREDGQQRRWRRQDGVLPSEAIYSGVVSYDSDRVRSLWLASRGGLIQFHNEQFRFYDRRDGLPSNAVRGIKRQTDPDGTDILWLATESGVARARLSPSAWRIVSRLGATENGIFGVIVEPNGHGGERLMIGSAREGIAMLDEGRWQQFGVASGDLPSNAIRALWRLDTPDGSVVRLAALDQGALFRISDNLSFEPVKIDWPESSNRGASAATLRSTPSGSEVWIGTLDAAVYRLLGDQLERIHPPQPQRGRIHDLTEYATAGGQAWIWAATDRGLARINEQQFELIDASTRTADSGYRSVVVIERKGRAELWASSIRQGVVRLNISDPMAPVLIEDEQIPAPPDPTVYSVLPDSQGRIYVCTNNGVQLLEPASGGGYEERVFRRPDGLVHDECNSYSQIVDQHDRYWVGTLAGLSVYDPRLEADTTGLHPGALHVTQLSLDGSTVRFDLEQGVSVPAGTREVQARFSLLSNQREADNRYRARMLGYEPEGGDWSAQPYRTWGELPPGEYRLRIEARNHAGARADSIEMAVEVQPQWHQWSLVRAGLVVLATGLLLGAFALYNQQLRQRKQMLEHTVKQRTAELNRVNRRLTELSYKDPLTGLANRRRLSDAAGEVLAQANRQQRPVSLILLDIDEFKNFNDNFGHLAGDVALQWVANQLQSELRPGDLVCRFGGEEFACLLPHTGQEQAHAIAERMRRAVALNSQKELAGRFSALTISAGLVSLVPEDEVLENLIHQADKGLYQAKSGGRNRVCVVTD